MAGRRVDEVDEKDADQTEAVLAATLAQALSDSDPTSQSPAGLTAAPWFDIVKSAIGLGMRAYLARVAFAFLASSGVKGPDAATLVDEIVPDATDAAIRDIADGVAGVYEAAAKAPKPAPRPVAPGGGPEATKGPSTPLRDAHDDVYRRVRVGSARLAVTGTTRAREAVRAKLAEGIGATEATWRTRRDNRVRMTHGALEGQSRPIGEPFVTVEGNSLLHPGDPTAPLSETANCRCRLSYLVPTTVRSFTPGDRVTELEPALV